jgi:poly-gamma-glutamate synthesis protein (capsule biosynthesis protein)
VRLAAEHAPDVALMDLIMPGMDGVEATRRLVASSPRTNVVMLTSYHDDEHVFPAIRAGALSYVLKEIGPDELADAVRASGWDACTTASNHSLDGGEDGIATTGRELDRRGIAHTGSFTSPRERNRPLILEVKGVKLGLVGYTDMTNGIPLPEPWAVNVAPCDDDDRAEAILRDVKLARDAGAEGVLVNMHWGDEYSTEPNECQVDLAERLTRSPMVAAVIGQGPHVVQPIRRVSGKFVVFSEGNLVSNQSALAGLPTETQDGLIALLDFVADQEGVRVERVRYVPTWVRLDDYVVLPAAAGSDPAYADSLRDSRQRTVALAGRGRRIVPVRP